MTRVTICLVVVMTLPSLLVASDGERCVQETLHRLAAEVDASPSERVATLHKAMTPLYLELIERERARSEAAPELPIDSLARTVWWYVSRSPFTAEEAERFVSIAHEADTKLVPSDLSCPSQRKASRRAMAAATAARGLPDDGGAVTVPY